MFKIMSGAPIFPTALIKGAGEMASAVAWRLHRANIDRLVMLDLPNPLCVRRTVSFCEALVDGTAQVEGVPAVVARDRTAIEAAWRARRIPVMDVDAWARIGGMAHQVVVDAILAKRNLGTAIGEADLVVALGPGFEAGVDCDVVVETNRGHDLGRLIEAGSAQADTGIPGEIAGFDVQRLLRAPCSGVFVSGHRIGDSVARGEIVGEVSGQPVAAAVGGILRGLIRPGTSVPAGLKVGDIDPRGRPEHCLTISDKARAIAGAVLEAILRRFNRPA